MVSMGSCEEFQGDLIFLLFDEETENLDTNLFEFMSSLENPYGILDYVRDYKHEGNHLFKQRNFEEALRKYELGAKFLTFISICTEEDRSIFWELAVSISLNLAACCLKTRGFVQAGRICSAVPQYDSRSVKALFRRTCAAMELGRSDLALLDLNSACDIEPSNKEVATKLAEAKNLMLYSPIQEDQESTPVDLGSNSDLIPLRKNPKKRAQEDKGTENHNERCSSFSKKNEIHNSAAIQTQKKVVDDHDGGIKLSSDDSIQNEEVDFLKGSSNGKDEVQRLSSEMKNQAEPKYRLYNRKRPGSFQVISKKDYHLIAQGKPLTYINSKTGSCVSIRYVCSQRNITKEKDMTNEMTKEHESKIDKDEDAMETTSNTVQSEGLMDESGDHNPFTTQGSQQNSTFKMAARKRLREARWKTKNARTKLHTLSATTYPFLTCRYQVGLKKISVYQQFDSDQHPRMQALVTSSCRIESNYISVGSCNNISSVGYYHKFHCSNMSCISMDCTEVVDEAQELAAEARKE